MRGEAVRMRLVRRNRRPSWLARRVAVTRGYMSQLMAGTRSPSAPLRDRLQSALEAEFDDLFFVAQETSGGALVLAEDDVA